MKVPKVKKKNGSKYRLKYVIFVQDTAEIFLITQGLPFQKFYSNDNKMQFNMELFQKLLQLGKNYFRHMLWIQRK